MDWFDGVEDFIEQLHLAEKPPANVAPSAAQTLLGIDSEIEVTREIILEALEDARTSANDVTIPATKQRLDQCQRRVQNARQKAEGSLANLYDQRNDEKREDIETTTRVKLEYLSLVERKFEQILAIITAKYAVEARANNEVTPRVQQVYKEYQRDSLSEYKSGIREYTAFKDE